MESETKVKCALHVMENPLDQVEMRHAGIMHEETHLLDGVCQVYPDKGEVLKSPDKTTILSGVADQIPIQSKKLRTGVNRCSCRVALGHAAVAQKRTVIGTRTCHE